MSCISANLDRVYESTVSFQGDNIIVSIGTSQVSQGEAYLINADLSKANLIKDNIYVRFIREGAIRCAFTYTCDINVQSPYLEINPEIVWIYSDLETSNDVLSNTTWYIN